jgi:hypothetical protein
MQHRSLYKEERYAGMINKKNKRCDFDPTEGGRKSSGVDEPTKCPLYSAFLLAFVLNFISAYTNP